MSTIVKLFCVLLLSFSASGQSSSYRQLDALLDSIAFHNKSMASVVMTRGGKKLYERAIGYQVIDRIGPKIATPQTRYVIGSVTKTFTATMIMQLIEEGN